jgi:hypothetical protein
MNVAEAKKQAEKAYEDAKKWCGDTANDAVKTLQSQIDVITQKAATNEVPDRITYAEKAFLQTLYHGIAIAGNARGWHEAAQLMRYYLAEYGRAHGPLQIDNKIYLDSPSVKAEMERQKARARTALRSQNEIRLQSGRILADHPRLKYADNRFILHSLTKKFTNGTFLTTWRVDNSYDFEPFVGGPTQWKIQSKWSEFPYRGYKVIIYDGLSRYLVNLNMAEEFDYYAEWTLPWN